MEDGDTTLVVSDFDLVPLGVYATIASSGDDGRVSVKSIDKITISPCNQWSSQTEHGRQNKILKGELLILSSERLKHNSLKDKPLY